jgi:hypothetical protein
MCLCPQKDYPRSPAVKKHNIKTLEVRVRSIKGVTINGKPVNTCFCMLSLTNQDYKMERSKSMTRRVDSDGEFAFDENFSLDPVLTLNADLNLRVFEPNLLSKNVNICELVIPLDLASGINDTDGTLANDAVVADETESAEGESSPKGKEASKESSKDKEANKGKESSKEKEKDKDKDKDKESSKGDENNGARMVGLRKEVMRWYTATASNDGNGTAEIKLGLTLK